MLSHTQARAVYDRLGPKQDRGAFYEAPALADLLRHGRWQAARHVFELGSGTGSFAHTLLTAHLPATAHYCGMDQSTTMVQLATRRLARFSKRATMLLSAGAVTVPAATGSFDRVIANYVLDLLSEADIHRFLAEAYRVLQPDGLLCMVSLTEGNTPWSRLVMWGWQQVYTFQPERVGGCRPIRLVNFLEPTQWRLRHIEVITTWGLASEVIIAAPQVATATQAYQYQQ